MKKIIALVAVLVLVLGCVTTAFAATKPTASVVKASKNQTVKPGKTVTFQLKLKSGSYNKIDGVFRSKVGIVITKDGTVVGSTSWLWEGNQTYQFTAKVNKNAPTGTYKVAYTTYLKAKATSDWKKVKTKTFKFTVKK